MNPSGFYVDPVLAAPKCSNTHIVLKRKSSDNV